MSLGGDYYSVECRINKLAIYSDSIFRHRKDNNLNSDLIRFKINTKL